MDEDVVIDFRGCSKIKELNIDLDKSSWDEGCCNVTIILDGYTDLEELVCTGRNFTGNVQFSADGCNSLKYLRVDGTAVLSGFVECPIKTVKISGNLMEQLVYLPNVKECAICCDPESESKFLLQYLPPLTESLYLSQPTFPQNLDERDAVSDESDEERDPDMDYRYRGFGIPKPDKKKCMSLKYFSDISDLKDRCPKLKEFTTNSMLVIPDKDKLIKNHKIGLCGFYDETRQTIKFE